MDILEQYGFRGTFFVEVFCAYLKGYEAVAAVFETIRKRGHDAQLHLHPVQRFYRDYRAGQPRREADLMFQLSGNEQRDLIGEGVKLFRLLSSTSPIAYRAGCYGAGESTIPALLENGIVIDSSYNATHIGDSCGFQTPGLNAPTMIGGIHEFPVTVFRSPWSSGYKPLEIGAVSVDEILATLSGLREAGCQDAVISIHSFSFLKNAGVRYENYRPDNIVIGRFRKLCEALSRMRGEVEVKVLGEADLKAISFQQPQTVPSVGWLRPPARKFVQGVNRFAWT
jgi:hypothetical protein